MNFKLWLELHQTLQELDTTSDSPDTFFEMPDFVTFIFDPNKEVLYSAESRTSHNRLIREKDISEFDWKKCLFGRYGQINQSNFDHLYWREFSELPVNIVTFYKSWGGRTQEITEASCDNCLRYLLNHKIIDGTYIVIDGIREPHYIGAIAKAQEIKNYEINGFRFTSENIRDWMGKLHFLPPTHPERQNIAHYAELIAKSPYAKEFGNFISRAIYKVPMKRSPWKQAMQDKGLMSPGHSLYWPTSEGNIS